VIPYYLLNCYLWVSVAFSLVVMSLAYFVESCPGPSYVDVVPIECLLVVFVVAVGCIYTMQLLWHGDVTLTM